MNDQERLFLAIGGADPALVARSERTGRRSRLLPWGLAAAACLALVLTLGRVIPWPWQTETPVTPPDPLAPPVSVPPDVRGDPASGSGESFLPKDGGNIGTLRLLSCAPEDRDDRMDFLIYVNEAQFFILEEEGICRVRSLDPLPEGFPACGLDILRLPGETPDQARDAAAETLRERYSEITGAEDSAVLPGSLYLRASQGLQWDAEQAELWFVEDGRGGAFVLAARYFLEAEEGLGTCFRDIASSFRVIDPAKAVPGWLLDLRTAAERLYPALFAGDLSAVSDLLTEDAQAEAYDENVWPDISVVSVDCAPDSDQDPSRATVSVKHRLNRVEGDSFSYLTMELVRREGSWYLSWSGIEK